MRGAIDLLGKSIEIDDILYEITNINFVPESNGFYIELENNEGLLNISLKDISVCIKEQINLKNGNGKKKLLQS